MWDPRPRMVLIYDPFFYSFERIELSRQGDEQQLWKSGSVRLERRVEQNLHPVFSAKPLFTSLKIDLNRPQYVNLPSFSYFSKFQVVIDS